MHVIIHFSAVILSIAVNRLLDNALDIACVVMPTDSPPVIPNVAAEKPSPGKSLVSSLPPAEMPTLEKSDTDPLPSTPKEDSAAPESPGLSPAPEGGNSSERNGEDEVKGEAGEGEETDGGGGGGEEMEYIEWNTDGIGILPGSDMKVSNSVTFQSLHFHTMLQDL